MPVLKRCRDSLTPDNVMRQATSLKNVDLAAGLSRSAGADTLPLRVVLPAVLQFDSLSTTQ